MTLVQIVNTFLILVLPALIALCYVFAQSAIQRMPSHQRAALEQFARMAVQHVLQEQVKSGQKEIATAYVTSLFKSHKLPVPSPEVLDIAVSSAIYESK